jgi:hypothetical protein
MATGNFLEECGGVATLTSKTGKLDRVGTHPYLFVNPEYEYPSKTFCTEVAELLSNLTKAIIKTKHNVFSFYVYKKFDAESGPEQLVLVEK